MNFIESRRGFALNGRRNAFASPRPSLEGDMSKKPAKKTETLEIRISHETKAAFMAACKARGATASAVIRGFIDQVISEARRAQVQLQKTVRPVTMIFKNAYARAAAVAGLLAVGVIAATPSVAADPRLAAVLQWWDANRDGGVSLEEFVDMSKKTVCGGAVGIGVTTKEIPYPDEPPAAMFRRLDSNHDGVLSLPELARQVTVETFVESSTGLLAADLNRDGAVTVAELAAHGTALCVAAGVANPDVGSVLFAEGMVAAHDSNGDGALDSEEIESLFR
jgi:Ca2+-binding EF-hand superfamily protein